jgi:hypothetical protein
LTEKAVEAWKQQGIGNEAEAEEVLEGTSAGDRLKMFQLSLKIRDDVIRLSRNPKLVLLEAQNPGELSVDDVSETDLDFLFKWVAAGGVASVGLAQFRNGSKQDVVDRPNRKARRAKAVAARGA